MLIFRATGEAINKEGMVARQGRIHVTRKARGKGMMGITLHYPYEVCDDRNYFR